MVYHEFCGLWNSYAHDDDVCIAYDDYNVQCSHESFLLRHQHVGIGTFALKSINVKIELF